MARQKSFLKLEGQIGDLTFFKTQDGYQVREKTGVSGDRVRNDPRFQRTRENGEEFGRAGKAGKLLRAALRSFVLNGQDRRMSSRLTREMMKVVKADTVSARGKRNVIDGDTSLLNGFEFNFNAKLSQTFLPQFTTAFDRSTGAAQVIVSSYVPSKMIHMPEGATHYVLKFGASAVDFENGTYNTEEFSTPVLALDNVQAPGITLETSVEPGSIHPVFMILAIEFNQFVNGEYYPLQNGFFNAIQIVNVDSAV